MMITKSILKIIANMIKIVIICHYEKWRGLKSSLQSPWLFIIFNTIIMMIINITIMITIIIAMIIMMMVQGLRSRGRHDSSLLRFTTAKALAPIKIIIIIIISMSLMSQITATRTGLYSNDFKFRRWIAWKWCLKVIVFLVFEVDSKTPRQWDSVLNTRVTGMI